MSGNELNPKFAAELASNVYLVKDDFSRKGFELKYKKHFNFESSTMAKGKTGGLIVLKNTHVMAFFAAGIGAYKGQAFIAIKGTASLYDALTDLNTGVKTCHTGSPVHQGFYYAFDSILKDLSTFISTQQKISTVHCIGHSLGGAIATLAADWIKVSSSSSVKLYTFGSPRTGLSMFAQKCSSRLSVENIYRVYHKTDPVPMVPTWPFQHVPTTFPDYLIYSPVSAKPWEYHLMKHYIASVTKGGSWGGIRSNRPKGQLDAAVEQWLKSDGVLSFCANTMELLDAALLYVVKKIMHVAGITLVTTATAGFTLLDRMAVFMAKAVRISADLSVWVFHLLKKMARLIGTTIKDGAELTTEFIRYVFLRLHRKVSEIIWHAGNEVS